MNRFTARPHKIAACLIMLLFCFTTPPGFAEMLTIDITQVDNALQIVASLDQETHSYQIDAQDMIVQKFKTIYYLLEPKKNETGTMEDANRFLKQQMGALRGFFNQLRDDSQKESPKKKISIPAETKLLLEKVGLSLFDPIHQFIETATEIEFVISEDEMLFPLDALFYRGSPLFIHKPVIYRFSQKKDNYFAAPKSWNGCMISDPNTTAGKAVLRVKEYFPNARHFNSQETRYEDIQRMGPAEFLLVSANGSPEGIELPHLAIRSWSLTPLKPQLAYLCASKMGLSIDFMKAFQQAGTLYYIAPIFGNEFDTASAKTTERFFRALSKGNSPSYAMYLTRKTLYDESLMQDDDFKWAMGQSFPFRVYRLN